MKLINLVLKISVACLFSICTSLAVAADWTESFIDVSTGPNYAEPGLPGAAINKNTYTFTQASGDKLGKNLLVASVLQSDGNDPAVGGNSGAEEFYGLYRRTFSLSRLANRTFGFGPVSDVNLVGRMDWETKNTQFAPNSRKLSGGVSFDFGVPAGFLEAGLYAYSETNHNGISGQEVHFNNAVMVDTNWAIPFHFPAAGVWKGSLTYIGAKGNDGFGNATAPETRFTTAILFNLGEHSGLSLGIGQEIWVNKYGNDPAFSSGTKQNNTQLIAEYKF